ncbi:MAG: transglycosylase domain-containing protein [Bacillota bacterium]
MARRSRRRKSFLRGRSFRSIILFTGALLGILFIGLLVVSIIDMPAWNTEALTSSGSTLIYDKDNKLIAKVGAENRIPISINSMPATVKEAFLAAEDHRFYDHHGVDFIGIIRAAITDITGGGKHQGASTITQQLVKLSFLSPEKTFKRKIQEVILAIRVEHYYTKDEILEMYINKIYFGQGAYGIQSAAQTYFKKNASELTLAEASLLAGIPKSPNYYDPLSPKDTPDNQPHQSKLRQKTILDLMVQYGYISQSEADKAYREPLNITKTPTQYPFPYFVDYVTETLINKYGEEMVYNTGLKVQTTIDPKIQTIAENVMADDKNFLPPQNGVKPQGAVVVLDPSNGQVRAIVGGREHTSRLGWNRATRMPGRQPGSAFKPIIAYGPAVEFLGMGPASVIDDAPVKYGNYVPPNFDGRYRGLITLRKAMANSVNIVAVKLLMDHVTLPRAIDFASRLGIKIDSGSVGASLALGTEEVTPLQLAGAYGAFDNGGVYNEPVAILKVENNEGKVLEVNKPRPVQAMKATTAYLITSMLQSVVQEGTGKNAYFGRPAACKTGTTDDRKDIWFAGYTPELVAVVWIGCDNPTPMSSAAYGGGYPATIWRKILSEALKNTPVKDFPRPQGIVSATVDNKSGLLPGPNTPPEDLITDIFAEGTVPTEVDNTHVLVETCATTGLLASEFCPDKIVRNLISLPYSVGKNVEDYNLRAPTEICNVHGAGGLYVPPPQNWNPVSTNREEKPAQKPPASLYTGIVPPE